MGNDIQSDNMARSIWPCCKETQAVPPAGVRQETTSKRAVIQFAVALSIALVLFFLLKKPVMAGIVTGISTVVLICGLFIPTAFLAIEKFGLKLGEWVAAGMTWLLLVPFFYICFVPGRLIMILRGKDPLNLRLSAKVSTYWVPRSPVNDIKQYEKQH